MATGSTTASFILAGQESERATFPQEPTPSPQWRKQLSKYEFVIVFIEPKSPVITV